jgi:hypothetical protein
VLRIVRRLRRRPTPTAASRIMRVRDARHSRALEGHSSGSAQEPGETRPLERTAWPSASWTRGGSLPVSRDSDSARGAHNSVQLATHVSSVRSCSGEQIRHPERSRGIFSQRQAVTAGEKGPSATLGATGRRRPCHRNSPGAACPQSSSESAAPWHGPDHAVTDDRDLNSKQCRRRTSARATGLRRCPGQVSGQNALHSGVHK